MVQLAPRLRLADLRRGHAGYFRAYRTLRRFGMTEVSPGQCVLVRFRSGSKGMDARGNSARDRRAGIVVALPEFSKRKLTVSVYCRAI
jgi:hypothetical protein